MIMDQTEDIHSRHCKYYGCKYGEEETCSVYLGYKIPSCDKPENRPNKEVFIQRREETKSFFSEE